MLASILDYLNTLAPFVVPLAAILGLLIGSFLNVVIYRVPVMMERSWTQFSKEHLNLELSEEEKKPFNLFKPHSHCPQCHSSIRVWQNIPMISYIVLGGQCGVCKAPISKRYPFIELLTSILFALVAWQYGWSWITFGGLILTAILIALTFIDIDTYYLPDGLTLPLVWLGLLFNLHHDWVLLESAVLGAVCGYMSLWLLCYVYQLLTGQMGMGGGDFKLLAALGAWLGVEMLPALILMSALMGIVMAVMARVEKGQAFAFGPSLSITGWLIFIGHDDVQQWINWWLSSSGF